MLEITLCMWLLQYWWYSYSCLLPSGKVTLAQLDLELHEVHEWFVLGVHLGIPPAQLHCIRHNFTLCTPLECRVEMLSAWMKLLPGPSWSRVVQALMTIGRESLAHEIALKYGKIVESNALLAMYLLP